MTFSWDTFMSFYQRRKSLTRPRLGVSKETICLSGASKLFLIETKTVNVIINPIPIYLEQPLKT